MKDFEKEFDGKREVEEVGVSGKLIIIVDVVASLVAMIIFGG